MVKAVKLADIAERVGVSVVTVSKALSGQKGVSEEMRARIKELADEMGYTPIHASSTGRARSYTIGVITFEKYFTKFASFYWKMYQELATRAVKKSCFSMLEVISSYDEHNLVPPKLITEKQKVDGIIIIGRPRTDYLKMLYQNKKIPMVFMDFYDDEEVFDCIVSASFNGMHRMTDYLIKNGYQRICRHVIIADKRGRHIIWKLQLILKPDYSIVVIPVLDNPVLPLLDAVLHQSLAVAKISVRNALRKH